MHQTLQDTILAQYPEWHTQPFRLTVPEMQNPYIVLDNFFDAYNLTQVRVHLRKWLASAVRTDEAPALDYICLHDQVERLIEAAWVLHRKGN